MGRFVNPNAAAFQCAVNSEVYIDKTGLLEYTNKVLGTNARFICNSRPRRFGKSVTVDMLTAYYSKGCDTEKMFSGLEISRCPDFYEHLNKYDVIHFDVQWCCISAGSSKNLVSYITDIVVSELKETYPEVPLENEHTIYGAMTLINAALGKQFIVIIDEWDILIRDEAHNQAAQEMYIDFLRNMFKGIEASKYIALAYLTGILPIKKLKTQSALNNFTQFTMLNAGPLTPYIGFNEDEVIDLCKKYEIDFAEVKRWYDGYRLGDYHVYNPNALVNLTIMRTFQSYWSQTGTYLSILPLINMDFDGLRTSIIEMLSGSSVEVNVNEFQNDMVSFADKDDVLTLLIHLGYLAYDQRTQRAYIPNEEIRQEFRAATKRNKWNELIEFQQESEKLLEATWEMDAETVAEQIEKIHAEYTSVIQYNNENSLSSVLSIAYLSAIKYYFKPIRELPTGRGFADFVFIPKPLYRDDYPALLVELKWNKDAETALNQIKERKYPESLQQYTGDILLVGINYDKKEKVHQCVIEKWDSEEEKSK